MGKLTTHVLDTAAGRPAAGIRIVLFGAEGETAIADTVTNLDGRTESPLLAGDSFRPGQYELRFFAGDYLRRVHPNSPEPLFLDMIPIRFGIADAAAHYHVPLLVSPFGYTTYRGS